MKGKLSDKIKPIHSHPVSHPIYTSTNIQYACIMIKNTVFDTLIWHTDKKDSAWKIYCTGIDSFLSIFFLSWEIFPDHDDDSMGGRENSDKNSEASAEDCEDDDNCSGT